MTLRGLSRRPQVPIESDMNMFRSMKMESSERRVSDRQPQLGRMTGELSAGTRVTAPRRAGVAR